MIVEVLKKFKIFLKKNGFLIASASFNYAYSLIFAFYSFACYIYIDIKKLIFLKNK